MKFLISIVFQLYVGTIILAIEETEFLPPIPCLSQQICGTNEVFIRDYDGFTYDVTCSSLCDPKPLPLPPIDIDYGRPSIGIPPPCSGGSCYCKPGYVRDDNYVCVAISSCCICKGLKG